MSIWIQVILVAVILAAMIMILLGIDHLFTGRFDADNTSADNLRKDVEHKDDVISGNSVFSGLVSNAGTSAHKQHKKPAR